ncbi:uncharacterized protein HD556DRAFT_1332446 [Suillus plorans]|uniref:Uncharacterized protein n=1 Tax=Suillus plorans TaxID=116603 RepID=A0A9P7DTX8_9AGAM|nr:uncharacterized protein HD556DRAFT_1332446 [Suillus plorans]KAG1802780.1 hypothetical protein HD556DRAFT_1332446 [Suillus plorans]
MGYLKEYVDRGVQTSCSSQSATTPDLAAVGAPQAPFDDCDSGPLLHEITIGLPLVDPELSPSHFSVRDNNAYSRSNLQHDSPVSPMCAPLISRRVPRRKLFLVERHPEGKTVERRVISMPDDMSAQRIKLDSQDSMRVVSMPEYLAAAVDLSLDSIESPSAGASFGSSYIEKRHRVRVCPPPSDVPHTPSPPSSPESILIIDSHAQLPDGFLRQRYSKKTASPGHGWTTWASSPPRPIPALHGPLSLPYARCPSGAEGTIIEEPGNVSRMIWGLGQDESCQYRGDSEHTDDDIRHKSAPHSQVTPQTQKRHILQKPYQIRAAANNKKPFKGVASGGTSTVHHRPDHERRIHGHSQTPHLRESKAEPAISGLPFSGSWRPETGIPTVHESGAHEIGFGSPFNDQKLLLDLQLAFAQQSLQNTALNQAYPEGLKPVFPVSNHSHATPVYPKIFVEPRLNEVVNASQRQSAMEIAQQYRQRQEFRLKQQAALPTPPSSSSPQWSSNFSPYQYPSVSPEMDIQNTLGLPHHTQQVQYPFLDTSQPARLLYDRQDNNVETHFFDVDGNGGYASVLSRHDRDVPSAVHRHPSDISGGLANYLRDMQTLSSQQPRYAGTAELPLAAAARHPVSTGRTVVSVAPPSPESPGSRSRSISYQQPRSVPLARLIQRRLSSVPEEELNGLADTSSISAYRFTDYHQHSLSSRDYSDDNTTPRRYHQEQHLGVPAVSHASVPSPDSVDEYEAQPYSFLHGASPAKVRLPSAQEQEEYLDQSRVQSRSKGGGVMDTSQQLKKKPRGRKTRSDACPISAR